ncbi:M20 metallopeptidase family protein [Clostridium senegalense]|uniref:M20 metallopeptidase family protein n=1 Tax=Clostridium senegalense TaxID=1465809 RepID=UPI001C10C7B4|nr:M20 family metallopeptidase [Clostridium senegalense]MBU5225158.1 amidohydrolase [Clostridium senegalense]
MDFLNIVTEFENELISLRREFHKSPELDFDLPKTTAKIKSFLQKEKIDFKDIGKGGIVAIIKGHKDGKTIAIRADMDALSIIDKKNVVYKSQNENKMHACGHDAHMTIALGTAKALNNMKENLKGNIKIIFEPAEETSGGSRFMIEDGVLLNPKVDAIMGLHVNEEIPCGMIGVKNNTVYAASNPFKVKIVGKGAHGASPHRGIDAIVIASEVILMLQTLVSREMSPTSPAVITVGKINGGMAQNAIADEVIIEGMIRTVNMEDRDYITKRFKEVIEGIVSIKGGKCEITLIDGYPCVINDNGMYKLFSKSSREILGNDNVKEVLEPTLGVESFSYFSQKVPAMFYWLGCRNEKEGIIHPAHSSLFDIDERCLKIGVATNLNMIINYLNN